MSHIIADPPKLLTILVRKQFVRNLEDGYGLYIEANLVGLRCQAGHSLQFQVRFQDREHGGAMFCLPIQALCWKPCGVPEARLIQPWDTFSSTFSVHEFSVLSNSTMWLLDGKERLKAKYVWTYDFENSPLADNFEQHKQLHFLKVEGGWFAAVPNNRILSDDSAFCKTTDKLPSFKSLARNFTGECDFDL